MYWCNSYDFGIGSVINPGNWGKMEKLSQFGIIQGIEAVLELVRINNYSNFPSRLSSVFLFENLQDAQGYAGATMNVYEVNLVDSNATIARCDMQFINYLRNVNNHFTWVEIEKIAIAYWSYQFATEYFGKSASQCITELIVGSPIEITRKI